MADYEAAVEGLHFPEEWRQAAETLAQIGDRRALKPLVQAYETPVEASKLCLLDAMQALGAAEEAREWFANPDMDEETRRLGLHLMELFPAEAHLPYLEEAVQDPNLVLQRQALRSLRAQVQTPAWEAVLIRLLASESIEVRDLAVTRLVRRRTDNALTALAEQLEQESDPDIRRKIETALDNKV